MIDFVESGGLPYTASSRREHLLQTARAFAALPARDRQLVRWMSEGLPLGDQAQQLGASTAATQRAGLRALSRFHKAFRLAGE